MAKKREIKTAEAARILEALAQADMVHSQVIEGWKGLAYLQFKDHLDRYRIEKKEYIGKLRRQDRRCRVNKTGGSGHGV